MRDQTRQQRYQEKKKTAINIPLSICTVNFMCDDNIAFVIRTAACFGVKDLYIIGSMPPRNIIHSKSGSMTDLVSIRTFKNPNHFLDYARKNEMNIISAELDDEAHSLYSYEFNFSRNNVLVLGHEETGIPTELLAASNSKVFIPMPGAGFCLNTSQTGTSIVTEFSRQYFSRV